MAKENNQGRTQTSDDVARCHLAPARRCIVDELGEILDEAYPDRGWSKKLQVLKSNLLESLERVL